MKKSICLLFAGGAMTAAFAEPSGSKFEKDREAILAMAGRFEVQFEFYETVALSPGYELKKPYEEDAAEVVFVVKDSPEHIVLQHVLLVESHNRVVKHWKQEWRYQDRVLLEYVGDNTWSRRELTAKETRGTWTQMVYQVDDSPRYESFGAWVHEGGVSSWEGNRTQRPRPRREITKRDDYDTFIAVNRHTITPTGWAHEQDNYKQVSESGVVLCREAGLNQYFRTEEVDFAVVDEYWTAHSAYWAGVSRCWESRIGDTPSLRLRAERDGKPLYKGLFETPTTEGLSLDEKVAKAESIIDSYILRDAQAAAPQ